MSFDLSALVTYDPAVDGQTDFSSPTQWYDCVVTALRIAARAYGYGTPYTPYQLREMGAPGTTQGLTWNNAIAAAQKAFPSLVPDMSIQQPTDLPAALEAAGEAGYLVIGGYWCSADAHVPPIGAATYSHACITLASAPGGFEFLNPEPWPDFWLSPAQVASLWDQAGLLVFQRSLLPAPPPTGSGALLVVLG